MAEEWDWKEIYTTVRIDGMDLRGAQAMNDALENHFIPSELSLDDEVEWVEVFDAETDG